MKPTVYLADVFHPYLFETLVYNRINVIQGNPVVFPLIDERLKEAHILIVSTKSKIDKYVIDACPALKHILRGGSGMDNIDTMYAENKGVICQNTPEGNRDSVAEHALGMMLALLHNFKSQSELALGQWKPYANRPHELRDKTIGIIGYGNTGMALAKLLKPFNCRVLVYDKFKTNYSDEWAIESNWKEIYEEADLLSLHIPLTKETRSLININNYSSFKKKIILVNTSRGEVVENEAIIRALEDETWSGAALDVVEDENNFSQSAIYKFINQHQILNKTALPLIITPHIAGKSIESQKRIAAALVDKLLQNSSNILSN